MIFASDAGVYKTLFTYDRLPCGRKRGFAFLFLVWCSFETRPHGIMCIRDYGPVDLLGWIFYKKHLGTHTIQ